MTDDDRLFGTTHFLEADSDLWEYSDAVMHWDCYSKWEHRARFARMYFDFIKELSVQNRFWGVAHSDNQVLVTTNPDKYVGEVDVMLAETGSRLRILLADWEDWLGGEWFEGCAHEIEREALAAVIPLLQSRLPSAEVVIEAAGMEIDAASETAKEGGMVARILHESACRRLAERVATKGITCPGCGNFSKEFDFMQVEQVSESGPQSHLVCRSCNREFGPTDV
jgi:hypothetical protein